MPRRGRSGLCSPPRDPLPTYPPFPPVLRARQLLRGPASLLVPIGTGPLPWAYWQAVDAGKTPEPPRRDNPLFDVIRRELAPR